MSNLINTYTARYYHTARTAHLERLAFDPPDYFFYSKRRLDFDESVIPTGVVVERVNCLGLIIRLYRRGITLVELPEPMAIKLWPQLLFIHLVTSCFRMLGLPQVHLVAYCIENMPVWEKLRAKTRLPLASCKAISRIVLRFLLRTTHKVAFGTEASLRTYEECVGTNIGLLVQHTLIWHLPRPAEFEVDKGSGVVFVGTFEIRKGILDLTSAWAELLKRWPESKLTLIGMGDEISHVREFAADHDTVSLVENPSRQYIFSALKNAKVLVLFSKRTPLWREQVGLPIVEGLAHGCEIVTSEETGLASWLRANGHSVLPSKAGPEDLACAIEAALCSHRDKNTVMSALPRVDGREEADRYLLSRETHI